MEAGKRETRIFVGLLVFAGFFALALLARAGSLEPNAPPGPTMKTLDQIYAAVAASGSSVSGREGYCATVENRGGAYPATNVLTVPTGKRFVLLRIYVKNKQDPLYDNAWEVYANSRLLLEGRIVDSAEGKLVFDFPDCCVAVESGETLKLDNTHTDNSNYVQMTIMGYYYNVP
jgi:hypothetical protein